MTNKLSEQQEEMERILKSYADKIHYPGCWDTLAYPSLLDALGEIGCNPADCTRLAQHGETK